MTDQVEDLTTEMLRPVHTKLDDIQAEMRLRFTGVQTGLAVLDQHLAAFPAVDDPAPTKSRTCGVDHHNRGQTAVWIV